jgi:hypothetical protein
VTKLLNFDSNRHLGFDVDRELGFSPDRDLIFNVDRELGFFPNRDLGFGKRGVIFRGYVCSNCKALVNPMAVECNECGAIFEPAAMKKPKKKARIARPDKLFCVYCGYPASGSDVYCRNCGLKVSRQTAQGPSVPTEKAPIAYGYDTVKLSKNQGKSKKVLSDWSDTGKDFEDFLE